jgi:peroxiredoxin
MSVHDGFDPLARALRAGDFAPAFTLPDPRGVLISSTDLLGEGPLVVTFYRGIWCPYCQYDLKAIEAAATDVRALGASLLAVARQTTPNGNGHFQHDNKISFPILDDGEANTAMAFGIAWTSDYLQALYEQISVEQTGFSPEPSWIVPMQARYVIGSGSIIAYADINSDYQKRPNPFEVLPVLDRLRTGIGAP